MREDERERKRERSGKRSRMDKKVKERVYDHEGCYGECELGVDPGRER